MKPAAIVPVHVQGIPGAVEDIVGMARSWGVPVVEDAAEALGSWRQGVHCGLMGDVGILSFNGNKTITTGGGGAILTNNTDMSIRAVHLSTQAKKPHKWEYEHDEVAGNSRMPNVNAAIGCAQMSHIEHILNRKEQNFESYKSVFSDAGCDYLHPAGGDIWNHWLVTLLAANVSDRDRLLGELTTRGVKARPLWKLLNEFGPYRQCISTETPNARWLYERAVALPSGVR
jgi:predicted outer membrane repeat protein